MYRVEFKGQTALTVGRRDNGAVIILLDDEDKYIVVDSIDELVAI